MTPAGAVVKGNRDQEGPGLRFDDAWARPKVTTSGLGDVIIKGRYYIVEERDAMPLMALTARVKFPTANEQLGLGTGALDYGFGVELSKMFGESWIGFLDAGYNIIGDPESLLSKSALVRCGRRVFHDQESPGQRVFRRVSRDCAGICESRDVFVAMNYTVSSAWRLSSGLTVGVSMERRIMQCPWAPVTAFERRRCLCANVPGGPSGWGARLPAGGRVDTKRWTCRLSHGRETMRRDSSLEVSNRILGPSANWSVDMPG